MRDHDAIIEAFRRVDPRIQIDHRGGDPGYTHIRGPSQNRHPTRCTTHWICVECFNGTVSLRRPLALEMKLHRRSYGKKIREHPLGYSRRPNFGWHDHALDVAEIAHRWPSLDGFAREVIDRCRAHTTW